MHEESKKRYEELFDSVELKAAAFDKIAEKYYYANFGSTLKSDFDTLMFSIYLERILDKEQKNYSSYSDYRLSKLLGITQSKVASLKVKKELLYPYEKFKWQESLLDFSNKAIYEDEKIKLYVPDRNLYIEIKNAIEEAGGFVEVQLTQNLIQVRLQYFLDLMILISEDKNRNELINEIKDKIEKNGRDVKCIENQPFGKVLLDQSTDVIIDIIGECIPLFGGVVSSIAKTLLDVVKIKRGL